jgi:hypothetical protein
MLVTRILRETREERLSCRRQFTSLLTTSKQLRRLQVPSNIASGRNLDWKCCFLIRLQNSLQEEHPEEKQDK